MAGIVRPGGCLRVVLHGEKRRPFVPHPFARLIVQIHVRYLHLAPRDLSRIDGEPVILIGDLHLPRPQIHHGMIRPMMAELELVGPSA